VTKDPVVLPSGLRFIDTRSVAASVEEYVNPSTVTALEFFNVTVSPLLPKWRLPEDAAIAFDKPLGIADAPAKTTMALPAANVLPDANV
jgi:hypothetical protein